MARTNAFLTVTDDVRHTYEQVFYGRQLTGNNAEPEASPFGPWTPPDPAAPSQAAPEAGLTGEVLGPEQTASGPSPSAQLEGPVIGGGTVHDHADLYGSIWGGGAPQIEAPEIEAPAIAPPDQGDDLTPGY